MTRRLNPAMWIKAVSCCVLWVSAGSICAAQTGPDPKLQKRTAQPTIPATASPQGISTLPTDASGEYLLDDVGSVIEITLDRGQLSGYVTKMGDEQSDKETSLTYFFDQASAQGDALTFTTKKVHGVSYSFTGTIVRGDRKTTRDENGYYRLKGAWTIHDDTRPDQPKAEEISLKSTPRKQ